ncbi:hypothetical protein JCM9140_1641 [Halalkalibacter wakoensis JCM 9140]|uniref:Uncharacterized protein n=1 Tax=Halalkalibacter wakoensis JCM 9140 TaxID=1236970 RepID=W4Q2P4_9BACI|nr:hypothetical protein [Halalkalibacter wakoensis]GAE25634.1 hypothetical protein JCM9140_1641 [Halalkalibacter wakoensis JCM 9140]
MNRILISILGVIVAGVSVYFIAFQNVNEQTTTEMEPEKLSNVVEVEEKEVDVEKVIKEEEEKRVVAVAYQENQEQMVKELIAKHHDYLNQLAGWGNVETIDLSALDSDDKWQQLQTDIKWLLESGFTNSLVVTDMKNAQDFMEVASSGDAKSLLYLHRIFHDLDANINDQNVDKIWDVTHAFGNKSEQDQLLTYLTSEQNQ